MWHKPILSYWPRFLAVRMSSAGGYKIYFSGVEVEEQREKKKSDMTTKALRRPSS
jgi:hypothetical protein